MDIASLAELTDADLLLHVTRLAHDERRATAALVAHLAEVENRKLYLGAGCASLFVYCTRVLHLSEHAAYNRIEAARAARRFPAVLTSLEQGGVHLTAIRLLAPVLTGENHRELLAHATHKSKREVEELLARLRPQPDVPAQVRKLPVAKVPAPSSPLAGTAMRREGLVVAAQEVPSDASMPAAPAAPPASVAPARPAAVLALAPGRYKVQFTVGAVTREKLRRAQELLRHRLPSGEVADVFDLALDLLLQDLERKKFAALTRPRRKEQNARGAARGRAVRADGSPLPAVGRRPSAPSRAQSPLRSPLQSPLPSRHIPAAVKRAVWERDRGCCAFVSPGGERCCERGGLEFDHIRPHADGGGATIDNVRLLCRRHNQYEAQLFFGAWAADGAAGPIARSG